MMCQSKRVCVLVCGGGGGGGQGCEGAAIFGGARKCHGFDCSELNPS